MASSKNSADKARKADKMVQALDLRKSGCSYRAIAKECGISVQTACNYVSQALDELREQSREEAKKLRDIESARLDELLLAMWRQAKQGDIKAALAALRIIESRRALWGTDAPIKTAQTTPDGEEIKPRSVSEIVEQIKAEILGIR